MILGLFGDRVTVRNFNDLVSRIDHAVERVDVNDTGDQLADRALKRLLPLMRAAWSAWEADVSDIICLSGRTDEPITIAAGLFN